MNKKNLLQNHKLAGKHFEKWRYFSLLVAVELNKLRLELGNQFELWMQQQLPEIKPNDVDIYFRMLETDLGKFLLEKVKEKFP